MLIWVKGENKIITASEGSGEALFEEDEDLGYVDYVQYDIMDYDGANVCENDGGICMFKEEVRSMDINDLADRLVKFCFDGKDVEYLLLDGEL